MARNNQILTGQARMIAPGEMVLDPGPRNPISIDTRSAVGAVESDPRAFAQADLGMAKIGEAVGGIGDAMGQLALKRMDAINITRVAEADDVMKEAELEMATLMAKEPDETKWGKIAEAHVLKTKERIGKMALSPVAKDSINSAFSRWEMHRRGETELESTKASLGKAKAKINDRTQLGKASQNKAMLEDSLAAGVRLGSMTEEEAAMHRIEYDEEGKRLQKQAEAEQRQTYRSTQLGLIQADPVGYTKEENIDPEMSDWIDTQQRQAKAVKRQEASIAVDDMIATGKIAVPGDVDKLDPEVSKFLRPADLAGWKQTVADSLDKRAQERLRAEAPAKSAELEAEIRATDFRNDPDRDKYNSFLQRKRALPEGYKKEIDTLLDRKSKDLDPEPDKMVREAVRDSVAEALRGGLLDDPAAVVPTPPAESAPVAEKTAYQKAVSIRKQQSNWKAHAILQAVEKEMQANPKMSLDEAQAVLSRISASPIQLQSPGLFPAAMAADPDSWNKRLSNYGFGPENDLPSGGKPQPSLIDSTPLNE